MVYVLVRHVNTEAEREVIPTRNCLTSCQALGIGVCFAFNRGSLVTRLPLHVLFQVLVLAISLKSVSADDVHLKRFKLCLQDGKTVEGTNMAS